MIKKYKEFIVESNEDIHSICKKFGIKNFNKQLTVNSDGSIDVDNVVDLRSKKLTKLPLKFGKVTGNFNCDSNKLTTLEGSPIEVGRDFSCQSNGLTTLNGSPRIVGSRFDCCDNKLETLEGCPDIIDGNFDCQSNKLTSLKGAPDKVRGNFYCNNNKLVSFKYLPIASGYDFSGNKIIEFLKYFKNYLDKRNLGLYLRLFEDIVQFPYLDDLEFEELAKTLKFELPKNWRDSVKSYKMLSKDI